VDLYEVEKKKLRDICTRQKGINITAARMREMNKPYGDVRIFAGGKTVADVDASDIEFENIIIKPSIIVKSRGNIDFEFYDKPFTHKGEFWSYSAIDKDVVNIKFVYYYLKNNLNFFEKSAISGKLPQIQTGITDDYLIPLPPLSLQEKIVKVLDKFESLTEDASGLLPKEIEARKKQYEYYREKLLNFKRCD